MNPSAASASRSTPGHRSAPGRLSEELVSNTPGLYVTAVRPRLPAQGTAAGSVATVAAPGSWSESCPIAPLCGSRGASWRNQGLLRRGARPQARASDYLGLGASGRLREVPK